MGKEIVNQVQEAQRVPYARERQQITYKGIPIRLTDDLSAETLQARRD